MRSSFKRNYLFYLFLFIFSHYSVAQEKTTEKYTISGYVKDANTGEYLIGANVYIKEILRGSVTNNYGFYSLSPEQGNYTLVASFLGYKNREFALKLDTNIRLNIDLSSQTYETKVVEIIDEKKDNNIQNTEMGTIELPMEKIKFLPSFFGETDILKTIQLLPGVQSAGEGNTGYYIRGGGLDQNLILLDEAVVYNASHLFGFFSIFNSDIIKNTTLIKGGMPANYGGRLASVLDISMKEGNSQFFQSQGGIGLIASRLIVQGPLIKNKASFIVSGRRTYIDILTDPFIKDSSPLKGSGYYFYDLNTKMNYTLSDKDRIFISGYFGRDVFTYINDKTGFNVSIPWGNATTSARWNHLFNNKLFMNSSLIFSDYKFSLAFTEDQFEFKLFSGIRDWNLKVDLNYFPTIKHNIKYGLNYIYHTFIPSSISAKSGEVELSPENIIRQYANEGALYIMDDFDLSKKIKINIGLRYSIFQHIGPFDRYTKDNFGSIVDTTHYTSWENIKIYQGVEPRAAIRYILNNNSSVKASYTLNNQYLHLTSFSSITLPTDIWIPSSLFIKPQLGTQYSIGYFRNFKKDVYETSVEIYYKDMQNLIEYKEGALPEDNIGNNVEDTFTFGSGYSYGAEFFLKKSIGRINGWAGYTLAWTRRKFPEINMGKEFYAKYDSRHDISFIASYDLTPKWTFSAVFVYGTGSALTLPESRYFIEGKLVNKYGDKNSYRMEPYHRADIAVNYTHKKKKRFESSWNFSIYNIYNRHNPYFIYFDNIGNVESGSLEVKAKQVSLFPILPSVTWNFKF